MTEDYRRAIQEKNPIQTIASVTNTAIQIDLPDLAQQITIGSRDAALWVSFSGTEGEALTESGSAFTIASNYLSLQLPHGVDTIYVSTIEDTTTTVHVIIE